MKKVQNTSTKDDSPIPELPVACASEAAAVEFMEKTRWGAYPGCVCCGSAAVYTMKGRDSQREKNYRWRCTDCKAMYSVRKGTVFEDSRIPLRHWCFAFWRAATSKKGVSALEIKRQTGLSYKSALFMMHRIRFAMAPADSNPLTGIVEVDETYVGGKPRWPRKAGEPRTTKVPVLAMVERGGQVRTLLIPDVTAKTLQTAIRENVGRRSRIMTDENKAYKGIAKHYLGGHGTVKHSAGEYVRGNDSTNTVEGYFSIVKRGLNGIYHAVSKKHLHRYLAEYEFRYNRRHWTDGQRAVAAIQAAEGKRLTYREPAAK